MSEFDKLRALLDPPKDSGPAGPRPAPKAASQEPEAPRSPAASRRWLWPLVILLAIVATDAAYLLVKGR